MKKPCSTCDSIIVVNGKSLPNPQCHSCRLRAGTTKCEHCDVEIVRENRSKKRRFCSPQCFGASGEGNRSRLKFTSQVMNCAWCDHPFNYTADHQRDGTTACSTRCGGYLRMKPSRPWKPPRVVVPKVEYVNTCNDCGVIAPKMRQVCESCRVIRERSYRLVQRHNRRTRERATKVERVDPRDIYDRDHGICYLCSKEIDLSLHYNHRDSFTLDHMIPLVLGGDTTRANLASAHRSCNSRKGTRLIA